jgi:hypothetical protein
VLGRHLEVLRAVEDIALAFGLSSPATARSKVVLPLPEGPSRATTSPFLRCIETPFRIWLAAAPVP